MKHKDGLDIAALLLLLLVAIAAMVVPVALTQPALLAVPAVLVLIALCVVLYQRRRLRAFLARQLCSTDFENSRILYRSILWSAHGEAVLNQWFSTNFNVEVHAYVKNGKFCVVNNTYEPQKTTVYRGDKSSFELELAPNEIKWYMI